MKESKASKPADIRAHQLGTTDSYLTWVHR